MSASDSSTAAVSSLAPSHSRAVGIALVRVLAICAIVVGHVSSTPWFAMSTFTWHVTVFFFLAGVLWSSGGTVRQEVVKRLRFAGAAPYLAWLLAISVLMIPLVALAGDLNFFLQTGAGDPSGWLIYDDSLHCFLVLQLRLLCLHSLAAR